MRTARRTHGLRRITLWVCLVFALAVALPTLRTSSVVAEPAVAALVELRAPADRQGASIQSRRIVGAAPASAPVDSPQVFVASDTPEVCIDDRYRYLIKRTLLC